METVVELVKSYLIPGSLALLLLGATAGLAFLYWHREARRWARFLLTALVVGYWLMSVPAFSRVLMSGLDPGYGPLASAEDAEGAQAIVVLGGGSRTLRGAVGEIHSLSRETASRVLEAARLYRLLDRPTVIASGGEETVGRGAPESRAMAHELQGLGVPENRILQDPGSQDTHEQALEMVGFLSDRGLERFVLVTSAEHMTRALGAFREVGLDPVPSSPSADPEDDSASMGTRWWPQESSLEVSRTALREYLALLYYWARGWLAIQ